MWTSYQPLFVEAGLSSKLYQALFTTKYCCLKRAQAPSEKNWRASTYPIYQCPIPSPACSSKLSGDSCCSVCPAFADSCLSAAHGAGVSRALSCLGRVTADLQVQPFERRACNHAWIPREPRGRKPRPARHAALSVQPESSGAGSGARAGADGPAGRRWSFDERSESEGGWVGGWVCPSRTLRAGCCVAFYLFIHVDSGITTGLKGHARYV